MLPLSVVDLPTVPALGEGRSGQEEFKAILGFIENRKPDSKKKKKAKQKMLPQNFDQMGF